MEKSNQKKNNDSGKANSSSAKRHCTRKYPKPGQEGSAYIVLSDSTPNQENQNIIIDSPLVSPRFETVEKNTKAEVGQTIYVAFEGEFEGGYWISVKKGYSSDPPMRGMLFKPEASNLNNEWPISAKMGMAATGSLGTGNGNPGSSSGMNNVPYLVTTAQGMNQASLEKGKNIPEEINLASPSPRGVLMAPPHLGGGTSIAFDFEKLTTEIIQKIKDGPHFDKLIAGVFKAINARPDFADIVARCKTMGKSSSCSGLNENVIDLEKVERHTPKLMQDEINEDQGKQNKGDEN